MSPIGGPIASGPSAKQIREIIREESLTRDDIREVVREELEPVKDALAFLASCWPGTIPGRKSHVARKVENILEVSA